MRNRRSLVVSRIKHLRPEQKVIAIAALVSIAACFMPWYGISSRVISEWWSGFGSIGSVAGYLITFFSLSVITLTLLPAIDRKLKLPWKTENIILLLSGQAMFLTLVFLIVYAQYSLYDSPNSSTRFGLYITLVSSIVTFLSALVATRNADTGRPAFVNTDLVQVPRQHKPLEPQRYQEPVQPVASDEQLFNEQDEMEEGEQEELVTAVSPEKHLSTTDEQEQEQPPERQSFNF